MTRFVWLSLLLIVSGCGARDGARRFIDLFGTPTPMPFPTPVGDTLDYTIGNNQYQALLTPNSSIPGAPLEYVGRTGELFQVRIDGFAAQKRAGDSFPWEGLIAPGVLADYNLVLQRADRQDRLGVNGNVTLTLFNPDPAEATQPEQQAPLRFENIAVDYVVPQGRAIPGTTLIYESVDGSTLRFTGTSGLPFYELRDSLRWSGLVRDNVYAIYDLQLQEMTEHGVRVIGRVQLFVYPSPIVNS